MGTWHSIGSLNRVPEGDFFEANCDLVSWRHGASRPVQVRTGTAGWQMDKQVTSEGERHSFGPSAKRGPLSAVITSAQKSSSTHQPKRVRVRFRVRAMCHPCPRTPVTLVSGPNRSGQAVARTSTSTRPAMPPRLRRSADRNDVDRIDPGGRYSPGVCFRRLDLLAAKYEISINKKLIGRDRPF